MSIYLRLILALLVVVFISAIAVYIEIPYNINTRGIVMPIAEWRLERLPDGSILNTERNNQTNRISYYSVLEFQRGDHAEIILNESIFSGNSVNKGDTIGYIRSFEEERRLLTLQNGLEEQKRLLQISLSGSKQEEINAAREELALAEKEYETQKKQVSRMEVLHKTGVIADEEWELALNDFLVKEQNMIIARSVLDVVSTGAKPEEQELIRSNINSFEKQITQTKERIDAFNILAPFSGTILRQQGPVIDNESIIRVANMDRMIVTLPVDFYQLAYIKNDNLVNLRINSGRNVFKSKLTDVDNTIQFVDQKQNVFLTALIEEEPYRFMPNMLVQAEIVCGNISAWDYFKRMFKVVFEN